MYQIKCDEYILYDPRDDDLIVLDPKCKLEVNAVGEGSFTIHNSHPFFDKLKTLKSIVEFIQDGDVIFRGRITDNKVDIYNQNDVDLEGVLGFTNDTLIPPFTFPDDFEIEDDQNVVEVLLGWLINQHNAQVQDFQKLKLGTVTVTDPNNVIVRSSEDYLSTWEVLKSRLFESSLGGYMYARYEDDGTYIDYVDSFELTNVQQIELTENILDLNQESDATETYSACIPIGAEIEVPAQTDEDGNVTVAGYSYNLTLSDIPDGNLTPDIVKSDVFIYSTSAVDKYGWICAPTDETTWSDVTDVNNLKTKSVNWLSDTGVKLSRTVTINAVDLHLTDDQIQRIRPFRNVLVTSSPHGLNGESYPLTEMEVDILNPQNTKIVIGDTRKTLIDIQRKNESDAIERIESVADEVEGMTSDVTEIQQQVVRSETSAVNTAKSIIFKALEEYVQTGNFEQYKETLTAQLDVMSNQISLNFDQVTQDITDVNGDLQSVNTHLMKFFDFGVNGLTIKSGENEMSLTLDNGMITFKKNGVQFGWWDGVDFHTGNIVVDVNERAQFGNFAFIPRSDGSLMFLKVGG